MMPRQILDAYMRGERKPVMGPLTYVEALGLVSLHDKLLAALQGIARVQMGSGVKLLQEKLRAHHVAHQVISLATNGGPVLEPVQGAAFQGITPVCSNCQHCPLGAANCSLYGWRVRTSSTCNSHTYRPMVAKQFLLEAAA